MNFIYIVLSDHTLNLKNIKIHHKNIHEIGDMMYEM